jgi:hypothetical protein
MSFRSQHAKNESEFVNFSWERINDLTSYQQGSF